MEKLAALINFIITNNLGDLASVIGVLISLIGFFIIIRNVSRSKNAVENVRNDILKTNTVAVFAEALSSMEEIKRLHRQEAWEILPDRYSALRKSLISIKGSNPSMSTKHKRVLQSAIQHFSSIEEQVENDIYSNKKPTNTSTLNTIISKQIDKLQQILIEIKEGIGR